MGTPLVRLAHSHTALKDFENCPLAYYHKRVVKDVKDPPSKYAQDGEEIHKHLELAVRDGTPLPDRPVGGENLQRYAPLVSLIRSKGQVECEVEIALTRELTPTTWFATDAWLRGKLDLRVMSSPTKVWIGDWKSGKRKPDFDQLELFFLMALAANPEIEEATCSFLWLKTDAIDSETYTKSDAPDLWAKHLGRIKKIERCVEAENWPARPSGLCNYCGYQPHCIYGKR